MSLFVHRMVAHGVSFVNKIKYPIGSLPKGAIETRNKANKNPRVDHV